MKGITASQTLKAMNKGRPEHCAVGGVDLFEHLLSVVVFR